MALVLRRRNQSTALHRRLAECYSPDDPNYLYMEVLLHDDELLEQPAGNASQYRRELTMWNELVDLSESASVDMKRFEEIASRIISKHVASCAKTVLSSLRAFFDNLEYSHNSYNNEFTRNHIREFLKDVYAVGSDILRAIYESLPPECREHLLDSISDQLNNVQSIAKFLKLPVAKVLEWMEVNQRIVDGSLLMIPVAAAGLEAMVDYYNGSISGKRAGANFVEGAAGPTGTVLGGLGGAALASEIGERYPSLKGYEWLGAIVGAVAGAYVGDQMGKWTVENIFQLPLRQALEEAYAFIEISWRAPDVAVAKAMADKYKLYSSKYGDKEKLRKLEDYVKLILVERRALSPIYKLLITGTTRAGVDDPDTF